jgi:hypothetical protein
MTLTEIPLQSIVKGTSRVSTANASRTSHVRGGGWGNGNEDDEGELRRI